MRLYFSGGDLVEECSMLEKDDSIWLAFDGGAWCEPEDQVAGNSPSAAVQEMERLMRIHEDIMRVLTIKVDLHREGPSVQISKREDRSDRRERSD